MLQQSVEKRINQLSWLLRFLSHVCVIMEEPVCRDTVRKISVGKVIINIK